MDKKAVFFIWLGIVVAVSGTFTTTVYSREEAVIYFWNCTASLRVCILANAAIFFTFLTIALMGLIYSKQILSRLFNKSKKHASNQNDIQKLMELEEQNRFRKSTNVHLEYKVNANSKVVNNYLLQNYINQGLFPFERQIRFRKEKYTANIFRSFSPDGVEAFQYGFIAEGIKETEMENSNLVDTVETIDELFRVTISQGQEGTSILGFDTYHKHCHMFTTELVQLMMKAFKIELVR